MKKITMDHILYYLISTIMFLLPLGKFTSYLFFLTGNIDNPFDINHVYILWLALPILVLIYILGIVFDKFDIKTSDILIHLLVISGVVSTVFAQDVGISILG